MEAPRHSAPSWTLTGAIDLTIKLAAVVGVFSAAFMWLVEPRFKPYTQVIQTVANVTQTLDRLSSQMEGTTERLARLEMRGSADLTAPLVFAERGNAIGDGEPGSTVIMRWNFDKVRECGAPIVDAYFEVPVRGSGPMPVTLRFREIGITSMNGRGIAFPLGPGSVAFPVTIPLGVPAGDAEGWIVHTYPDCPMVPAVRSPRVGFTVSVRMAIPDQESQLIQRGEAVDPLWGTTRG